MIHQPVASRLENGPIRGSSRRKVRELAPFIVFLVTIIAVGSSFIYVRSGINGIRKQIGVLSKEKERLVEENRVLHRELATLSSPSRIIPLAQAQGFVFPEAGSFRTLALADTTAEPGPGGPDAASPGDRRAESPLAAFLRGLIQ